MKNVFRRFYSLFIIAALAICLTSCFDLKEEISINSDGSGSFIQTIDLGDNPMMQMALNMQNDSTQDADNGMNKMDSTMQETKEKLSKIKGISNVRTATATEGLKYTIMYDFADVDALNRAVNAAKEEKESQMKVIQKQYSFKKGKFTRANAFSMGDNGMDMSEIMGGKKGDEDTEQTEEEKAQMKQMMQMFFGSASYTYIVHVPNKVKSYSNKSNTTVSEDKKTLTMTIPFMELLGEGKKADIGNSVKFE
jgi:hypothetical protein